MKSSKQRRGETGSDLIWSAESIPSTRGLDWVLSTTISWAENNHRNTVTLTTEWRSPHLHSGCLLTNLLTGHQTTRSVSSVPIIDHPIDRSLDCDLLFFTSPSDFCSHYSRSFLLDRWWWPSSFVVSSIQFNPRYALAVILYQKTDPWWTWLMYCN